MKTYVNSLRMHTFAFTGKFFLQDFHQKSVKEQVIEILA